MIEVDILGGLRHAYNTCMFKYPYTHVPAKNGVFRAPRDLQKKVASMIAKPKPPTGDLKNDLATREKRTI